MATGSKIKSTRRGRRPSTQKVVTRSCRIPEQAWEKYVDRADGMFIPPSRVMTMLVEAFAAGDLDLPMTRYVYDAEDSRETSEEPATDTSAAAQDARAELGESFDEDSEL